jgi:hypothetical protein
VAPVVLLEEFHRPDRLPHLPFLRTTVLLKVLGEGRQGIVRSEASGAPRPCQEPLEPPEIVWTMPVIHQIPTFPIGINIMQVNGLRHIHIVSPVDCVWPLCTGRVGNCIMKTVRIILEQRFYVHKNRLAVMYRLALHTVKNRELRHSVAPRRSSGFYVRRILISKYIRNILKGA